jgi:hypothetical protein
MRSTWLSSLLVVAALSCGPVKNVGPTALHLEVYFSEARGTKARIISGTAEIDGVPVNVFPTSQRPEQLTGAAFPVPQTLRVLLNDSRGGVPMQVTVIGINADGDAVEAATQTVTPAANQETNVVITLKPFTDTVEPDGGVAPDAGVAFDGGARDAGVVCNCPTGCCDGNGRCATLNVPLGSGTTLNVVFMGPVNGFCTGVCPVGKTSHFANGACQCGTASSCGDGLRCQGQGNNGRCLCDASSGCRGCCLNNVCDVLRTGGCGNAGNQCARCEGAGNVCSVTGHCTTASCLVTPGSNQCCSGTGLVSARWPTCTTATGDCVACDVLRSNVCRPVGVGSAGQPCGCGAAAQCASNQLCVLFNGAPTCVTP